jgi:hypothetical protein
MFGEGAPMRTFPILLAATAVLPAPASAAVSATRNFGITGFDRVRIEGPYIVRLTNGVAPFARATGDQRALDGLNVEVRGNTLVVGASHSAWGGYPGTSPSGTVEIELGTHELSSAWLVGSGSLAINRVSGLKFDLSVQGSGGAELGAVDVDQMSVNLGGTSNAKIAGKVGTMTAIARGMTSLDASATRIKDATIGVDGAATVSAEVRDAVTVDGMGPATITLTGRPACTLRLKGSATVSGCKTTAN